MRIYSEYQPNESGKGKFLGRLFPELEKLGAKIQFHPEKCDVRLALTRIRTKVKGVPTVLRLDGIHLVDNKKNRWNNERVKKSIKKADAVIYQSQFSKRMIEPILKVKPKAAYVIHNGASPAEFPVFEDKRWDVCMVARWANRKHKRLREMLEVAKLRPDLKFIVCGEIDHPVPQLPNVEYTKKVIGEAVNSIVSYSRCMLNLASFDWCPNAVVESIVAGTPVIGYSGTGVGELIGKRGGVQLVPSEPLTPKMMKKEFLPEIIPHQVAMTMDIMLNAGYRAHKPSLYIENIAKQYFEALESVFL